MPTFLKQIVLILVALLGVMPAAQSGEIARCAQLAADHYDVPHAVMITQIRAERGWPGAEQPNTDGSFDLGVMQINNQAWWEPELKPRGISYESLRDDVCVNLSVGAWILRQHFDVTGDWVKAMLRYHSKTPKVQARYAAHLRGVLRAVIAEEKKLRSLATAAKD